MVSGSDQHAPLPLHQAFVVQLAAATRETGQRHARVEHVISQHTTPFASLETLLALMRLQRTNRRPGTGRHQRRTAAANRLTLATPAKRHCRGCTDRDGWWALSRSDASIADVHLVFL